MTQQLTGHSNPNVFKTIQPNLSRTHHISNFGSINWMHAPLCRPNYLLTGRSNVHRGYNTSPLREVQLFTSMWSPNQLLLPILENPNSFIWAAPPNDCAITTAYVPSAQEIKPFVVHLNELHWAQPILFFAATDPTGRVVWTSSTWDTCFFITHLRGFPLVPLHFLSY